MPPRSWPEIKYPSRRDEEFLPSCEAWLCGKQIDDGAEGLWRIHDKLYDMEEFISKHPGGTMWLELTRGTDITESFEVHHLTPAAEKILPKYYVRDATTPRNSPFTFHEDGFYKTIKREVLKHFNYKIPKVTRTSKIMIDFLFFSWLLLAILTARFESIVLPVVSGLIGTFIINGGHNFTHMKDTWRNYYFHFLGFSIKEWRISHCMSHHMFPNTLKDLEVWIAEPWLQFLPNTDKPWWMRYGSWLYSPFIFPGLPYFLILNRMRVGGFDAPNFLFFLTPLLMLTLGKFQVFSLFLWLVGLSSFGFIFSFIGLTVAHHDHETFHEGDIPRKDRDWGLHQIDATLEKKEIIGNKYLGLLFFGEHTLHHLFPTIDFMHLKELIPIYKETLKEFGLKYNAKSYPEMIKGTFIQMGRSTPNMIVRDEKRM